MKMDNVDFIYQRELGGRFLSQYNEGRDVWSDETQMRDFAPFALTPPFSPCAGAEVVDLGAGRGHDTLYFLRQGFHVTALDLFRMPEWQGIQSTYGAKVNFLAQGLLDWVPPERFRRAVLVFDNGCYHHQAKSVQAAYLRKVGDLMLPGSRFAVNVFVCRDGGNAGTVVLKDGRFVHVYDEDQIRSELLAAGFLVTHCRTVLRPSSSFAYDYLYVNALKNE